MAAFWPVASRLECSRGQPFALAAQAALMAQKPDRVCRHAGSSRPLAGPILAGQDFTGPARTAPLLNQEFILQFDLAPFNLLIDERFGPWSSLAVYLGLLLGALLVLALLALLLRRWALRHEAGLRQAGTRFLQRPTVRWLRLRLAPQLAFIQARLTPGGYLGLQLTLGALLLLGASWLFGGIAEDVLTGDPLTLVDLQVAQWFHAHTTAPITRAMLVVTHLHDPNSMLAAVLLLALGLAWRRDWYWLIAVGLSVPLGMGLNVLMKYAFQRARPSFDEPLLLLTTYSFPSGHVAGATLFYGVLAALLVTRVVKWRWRLLIVLTALFMVVLVALTRVYLGVHYLSDVLAAFAEAVAWLALCLTGLHTYWQHARSRHKGHEGHQGHKGLKGSNSASS
jgi:membrane-associated phospholipid phosphatase